MFTLQSDSDLILPDIEIEEELSVDEDGNPYLIKPRHYSIGHE